METGIVFDIREFSVHDGPGIRTTVFLKGCPLTCLWCHNPEGQSAEPQEITGPAGSRISGITYLSSDLAALLNRQKDIFKANEGGVTFSGGEPLSQAKFVAEVIDRLDGIHVLLDTSGCGTEQAFCDLLKRVNLVYYDLKIMDPVKHRRYTGHDNALILNNLQVLSDSGIPFVIRVPLIPGVSDTNENLEAVAEAAKALPGLQQVDLLPYNRWAGAKYKAIGRIYQPDFDTECPVNANEVVFTKMGIKVSVR